MAIKGNYDFRFSIKDFYAGMADNAFLLPKNSVVSSYDVDLRTHVPDIAPKAILTEAFDTSNNEMHCSYGNFQFGEDGKGYKISSGTEILDTGHDDIVGVEKYNDMLILFEEGGSSPKIHKLDYDDVNGSSDFTLETSYDGDWTPTNWTTLRERHGNYGVSTMVFQGNLYFSNDDQVIILDEFNTMELGLKCPATVVGITVYGSRLKIYCENGDILFWSGIEGTSWEEQIRIDEDIFMVLGSTGRDFVFAGENNLSETYIYEVNGYSLTLIKDGERSDILSRAFATPQHSGYVKGGILYFPGGGQYDGIYTYGRALPGLPELFEFGGETVSDGTSVSNVYNITNYQGNTYASMRLSTGATKTMRFTNNNNGGYIVTQVYGDRVTEHNITAVEVKAGERVVVSYKYNRENIQDYNRESATGGWTEWFDTDNHEFENNVCRITGLDLDNMPDFKDIQFKIHVYGKFTSLDLYGQHGDE